MAKEYGFEYELVQYKWPRWLHQQTEKQRTIWGYKILFLDVLFPLNVKKIIFVDADQVEKFKMCSDIIILNYFICFFLIIYHFCTGSKSRFEGISNFGSWRCTLCVYAIL